MSYLNPFSYFRSQPTQPANTANNPYYDNIQTPYGTNQPYQSTYNTATPGLYNAPAAEQPALPSTLNSGTANENSFNNYNNINVVNQGAAQPDYAYQGGQKTIVGYSNPTQLQRTEVVTERVTDASNIQYGYYGPFRRPWSTYTPTISILGMLLFGAIMIAGIPMWAIEASKSCDGLSECENYLILDIGVGFTLLGAILFCGFQGYYVAAYKLKLLD